MSGTCKPARDHCAHWYDGEPCCVCGAQGQPRAVPVRGQRWTWEGLTYVVTRVSRDFAWADIQVEGDGGWSKRQPLPLPVGSVLVGGES